jgi:GMP synthase (glutamine-hydrolysing)
MPAAPLYCTQFHPELDRTAFIGRVHAYPEYVERIAGTTIAEFEHQCLETPAMNGLLAKFARLLDEGRL